MHKALVVHVNAMQRYAGFADDEIDPREKAEHNTKDQVYERYIFKVAPDGNVYAAWSKSQIDLARIDPNSPPSATKLSGVLVVFWATFTGRQRRVVGWYTNATIWAKAQESNQKDRDQTNYICRARESVLLGPDAKPPAIPLALREPGVDGVGNHFGHWYPFAKNGEPKVAHWLDRLVRYVGSYRSLVAHVRPDLIDEDEVTHDAETQYTREHGYAANATIRKTLEEYAVARAVKRFTSDGYHFIREVGKPYDLLFSKDGQEIFVEVKGTQTDGSRIFLTPNEVACSHKRHPNYHLFIVHSIVLSQQNRPVPGSGIENKLLGFRADPERLRPLSYSYLLD